MGDNLCLNAVWKQRYMMIKMQSICPVISAEPFLTPHRTVIPRHTGKHWPAENQLWISRWWTHQIVQPPHLVLVETVGGTESHVIIQQNTNLQPVVGWSTPHPHTQKKILFGLFFSRWGDEPSFELALWLRWPQCLHFYWDYTPVLLHFTCSNLNAEYIF